MRKPYSLAPGASSGAAKLSVAQSVGLKTPPDPTLDRGTEPEARAASTIRSPVSSQGSDPEFPLDLIVSPEPSLTEGLSRPKGRFLPSHSDIFNHGIAQARLPRSWLWGLIALTVTVLVLSPSLAFVNPFGEFKKGLMKQPPLPSIDQRRIARRISWGV